MRIAAILSVVGLAVVLWYTGWGVHGCSDAVTEANCAARMDRDFTVYLIGLASLACGIVLGVRAGLRRRRRTTS